ncbi:GNAT family N-acetyltransferase [Devosia aquimaris]|uniref:GNAT family N-acetyltransferase n=1 Tax=Devosia aquimaris TaxID=2866214 RepID=UPI001CD12328|nr:GNAT family N-acetyltransferase [Devosia sp. CJK-A8-3]
MTHPLDRPIWSALTGEQAAWARGTTAALRFERDISPFAAPADQSAASLAALQGLVEPDEQIILVQSEPIVLPPGLTAVSTARAVQMVAPNAWPMPEQDRLVRLGTADEAEMYALAMLTRPGPFAPRSMRLGEFWGIRQKDRLVGMAGERLRQGEWVELSGVCVHPDARGQGLGRLLSGFVAERIRAKAKRPYLHVFETNTAAIRVYGSLGFATRAMMNVTVACRT